MMGLWHQAGASVPRPQRHCPLRLGPRQAPVRRRGGPAAGPNERPAGAGNPLWVKGEKGVNHIIVGSP